MPTDEVIGGGGWRSPGEPLDPHWSGLPRWGRLLLTTASQVWTLSPWAALGYAGAAVGLHRWPGAGGHASALLCAAAAWSGWRLLWRVLVRGVDVGVAALLRATLPEPEPWALFLQFEERVVAAHTHACLHRWGVSPRSSGWERLAAQAETGWRREGVAAVLLCLPLAVHPWWLG